MKSDEARPDFNATKAELFEAISHPVRIKILQALSEKPMGFAELGRAVGIESGGHLSFHLTKLRELVKMTREGNYALTGDGKEALWSVNALQKSTNTTTGNAGQATLRHRSWLKPTLAIILLAVTILGGVGAYQQGEFAAQQQQLASQQKLIGVLQSGLPFTNGQSASVVIGQKDFAGYSRATAQDGLSDPVQVVFDSSGNMWVSEYSNHRLLEFKPPFSNGMSASLVIGQENFTSREQATSRNRFGFAGFYTSGQFGVAFDAGGNLWVADFGNNRILEFKPPFSSGMNAFVVIGQEDFTHDWTLPFTQGQLHGMPASANRFLVPTQPAFDSFGNLWVLDSGYNRVLEFKPPFRNGMNASLVLGQADFRGHLPQLFNSCSFCEGNGGSLAIDASDNVWVGDPGNNRVLKFKPPFAIGMNASSFEISQQNLPANTKSKNGENNLGWTIAFDPAGNLWVTVNDRYMAFKPPFIEGTRAFPSLEIGQPNFTSTAWTGGPNGLSYPSTPGFDSAGNLWVSDSGNNRVLEFVAVHSAQRPAAPGLELLNFSPPLVLAIGAAAIAAGATGSVMLLRRRRRGVPPSHLQHEEK